MKRDGVFQRKDSPGFYVSYVDAKGVRRKRKVHASTRRQALDALSAIKSTVQREALLGIKAASDIATADALKRFLRHQRSHVTVATLERQTSIVETLKAALPKLLRDVTRASVAELIAKRSAEVAPATVQKEVSVLKRALALCVEWELIIENAATRAAVPRNPEGRTRFLTPPEMKRVLEEAQPWMRAPLALSAFTGMRRGEILKLRWQDVDMKGRRAYLRNTKNGTLRIVPLNSLAMGVIQSLKRGGDMLFEGFTPQNLSVATRRLFSRLNIKDASFHSLRHTAASWLAMEGVPIYDIGQILGHKTPRMTTRYAHLSPEYSANAVSKIEKAFAGSKSTGLPRDLKRQIGTDIELRGTTRRGG